MAPSVSKKADRIFVRDGRRAYRRRYSVTEPRIGIAIFLVLASILGWVAWKGAHPDPNLFMLDTDLAQGGSVEAPNQGPVPTSLAAPGWSAGEVSKFDYDNLYVKIDGREGYYKSFGFEMLYFLSIVADGNPQIAVDIELYDLGSAANAIGAYSGERSPGATPVVGESGLWHIDRNALFLTRGRYYLRAIGSEESAEVGAELGHLRDRFDSELPGEPLPWGYALFVGRLGMSAGAVSFAPENAFSFAFGRNVYSAELSDGAELYVTPAGGASEAEGLARRYLDGFRNYGSDEDGFVKDRYMGTYATARAAGPWVVGIRRATDTKTANDAVDRLAEVVRDVPLPQPMSATTETTAEEEEEYDADGY
jgi:hypothetical protein